MAVFLSILPLSAALVLPCFVLSEQPDAVRVVGCLEQGFSWEKLEMGGNSACIVPVGGWARLL